MHCATGQIENIPFKLISPFISDIPIVPSEPRWSAPRSEHISCPGDPSGNSQTIAVSYLLSPIEDTYETFVLRVVSELLVDGPSAPFYRSLIESGLGSAFSPVTGKIK